MEIHTNLVNEYTSVGSFSPSHDANGNLLTGQVPGIAGLQTASFTWNIHNELVSATAANGDTAQYQYDAFGRRTKRTETIGGVPVSTWFLANGWNVELEYENGAYARRMTWGQDLSGSLQGAGGVGGLVMFEELPPGGGAPIPSFPTYDGNGNITAWVNASGTVISRQRYDAFGNIIEQTGTAPSRYGFSTKPIEFVTGFLYYGYRYYDPVTGRCPSTDPIEEEGGINLYGFVGNDNIGYIDILGLSGCCGDPDPNSDADNSESGYVGPDPMTRRNPCKIIYIIAGNGTDHENSEAGMRQLADCVAARTAWAAESVPNITSAEHNADNYSNLSKQISEACECRCDKVEVYLIGHSIGAVNADIIAKRLQSSSFDFCEVNINLITIDAVGDGGGYPVTYRGVSPTTSNKASSKHDHPQVISHLNYFQTNGRVFNGTGITGATNYDWSKKTVDHTSIDNDSVEEICTEVSSDF